jgi:hypothetical protein
MTENRKLHNPLPEPVQGRRQELNFPIQDVADAEWEIGSCEESRDVLQKETADTDDFDVAISEDDDFDL